MPTVREGDMRSLPEDVRMIHDTASKFLCEHNMRCLTDYSKERGIINVRASRDPKMFKSRQLFIDAYNSIAQRLHDKLTAIWRDTDSLRRTYPMGINLP